MHRRTALCGIAIIALVALGKAAQTPDVAGALRRLSQLHDFEQVAISPDGSNIAWVELIPGAAGALPGGGAAFCQSLQDPAASPQRITAGKGHDTTEHNLRWAPDGKRLAFLSDAAEPGQLQLYVTDCAGKSPKAVSAVKGFLADPAWSPDASHIAVLLTEGSATGSDPLNASPPRVGEIGEKITEQRIATIDPSTGVTQVVSPADMYIYEYDWAPDGSKFVVTAAAGSGENNWWLAQLYVVPAAGGAMTAIYKPPLQIASPRWSPDGKSIAFIAGLMSDEASTGGDIFLMDAAKSEPKNLSTGARSSTSWFRWTGPGTILALANSRGRTVISRVQTAQARIEELWSGDEFINSEMWMGSLSITSDGKVVAAVSSSFEKPPEIIAGPIGSWKPVTRLNTGVKPEWGKFQTVEWKSEGFDVQGWVVLPPQFNPANSYPMVVVAHGGPGSVMTAAWPKHFFQPLLLSAQGYLLFFPNPRGSFGQGETFTKANVKDFGGGDLRDLLVGMDAVLARFPVDPKRIGLTGWSYGGFMSMFAVTQTNRFAAAVAGAGISNWQSYYGQNEIDQWMIPYFGASVYDDPAVYARASAITFIKKAKTPTLVVVGERDAECPAPQSFEFWHALKAQGVPTALVVYSGEGHHFQSPDHVTDVNVRMIDWFNRYLGGPATRP